MITEIFYYLSAAILGLLAGLAFNKLMKPIYDKVRGYWLNKYEDWE